MSLIGRCWAVTATSPLGMHTAWNHAVIRAFGWENALCPPLLSASFRAPRRGAGESRPPLLGSRDDPLTELGQWQAIQLAHALRRSGWRRLYESTQRRALEDARQLARMHHLSPFLIRAG